MIKLEDYFGRVSHIEKPSPEVVEAAKDLIQKVNWLLISIPHPIDSALNPSVNSGWRPASYNANVPGAAVKSKHITGHAIDLADPDGGLDEFLFGNQQLLITVGIWLEHPLATKNWCHLQSIPPRSGNRVFFP